MDPDMQQWQFFGCLLQGMQSVPFSEELVLSESPRPITYLTKDVIDEVRMPRIVPD